MDLSRFSGRFCPRDLGGHFWDLRQIFSDSVLFNESDDALGLIQRRRLSAHFFGPGVRFRTILPREALAG